MEPHPRLSNRGGDCLLGNWVEERKVKPYDPEGLSDPNSSAAVLLKDGNMGILTTKTNEKLKKVTTHEAAFSRPMHPTTRTKGSRQHLIEQTLAQRFRNELHKKLAVQEEEVEPDYNTEYTASHNRPGFVPTFPEPTRPHDVNTDMGVSYWTEHADKIEGVTEFNRAKDTFKKNATFSTPIDEKYDDLLHMGLVSTI